MCADTRHADDAAAATAASERVEATDTLTDKDSDERSSATQTRDVRSDDGDDEDAHDAVECRRLRINNSILQGNVDVLKALVLQLANELELANARAQLYVSDAQACTCRQRGNVATLHVGAATGDSSGSSASSTTTATTPQLRELYAALQAKDVIIDELARELQRVSGALSHTQVAP